MAVAPLGADAEIIELATTVATLVIAAAVAAAPVAAWRPR